jgi:hypothetical protein
MRRRLYFGLPNSRIAPAVMNERQLDHIDENHIHVHARHQRLLEQLPKAGAVEISDILHGALACAAWAAAIATAAPGYACVPTVNSWSKAISSWLYPSHCAGYARSGSA